MNATLTQITSHLNTNGFSARHLTVEDLVIIHDEDCEWTISPSTIKRYAFKSGQWMPKAENFKNFADFMVKFEALMSERVRAG